MPFRQPYDSYYPAVFKAALEDAGYEVARADDLFTPRPIMLDIQRAILDADLILCEMSEKNPNVFYELGLAHAIGRPAILVSRKEDDIPFDLRHLRVIVYDYTVAGWEGKLRQAITAAARSVEPGHEIWPPALVTQGEPPTSKASLAKSAATLLKEVQSFYAEVLTAPDGEKILELSIDSFRHQDDQVPRRFKDIFERLALPPEALEGLDHMTDLDDRLFLTYRIPFLDVDRLLEYEPSFLAAGLKSESQITVRDYRPVIRGANRTDKWSVALHKKAVADAPDQSLKQYVHDLIEAWRDNRKRYGEFIDFWHLVRFDNKYMRPDQFFAQKRDVAERFCQLYDEVRTHLAPSDYARPYSAGDYIKELMLALKRVSRGGQ